MYRYADSEPLPSSYNILAVMSALVGVGGALGEVLAELAELRRFELDSVLSSNRELAQIDLLSGSVVGATETALEHCQGLSAPRDLARKLQDFMQVEANAARTAVEERRRERGRQVDEQIQESIRRVRRLAAELLMTEDIPIAEVAFHLRATAESPLLSATCTLAGGIEVDYELETGGDEDLSTRWQLDRLVGGERITVGVRPRRFRRGVTTVRRRVDDYRLLEAEVGPTRADLRLARRGEELSIALPRKQADQRPRIQSSVDGDRAASPEDIEVLEALADNLYAALTPLLSERVRVVQARAGTEDALSETGVVDLVEALTTYVAPLVAEIARRTPSRDDLRLIESGPEGSRTLRVAKAELVELLPPVGAPLRRILERLPIFPPDADAPRLVRHETAESAPPGSRPRAGGRA